MFKKIISFSFILLSFSAAQSLAFADTKAETVKPEGIDFFHSDAPFKFIGKIGEHNADIQFYGIIDIGAVNVNHSLKPNQSLPNSINP